MTWLVAKAVGASPAAVATASALSNLPVKQIMLVGLVVVCTWYADNANAAGKLAKAAGDAPKALASVSASHPTSGCIPVVC